MVTTIRGARVDLAGLEPFGRVLPASDKHVHLDVCALQCRQLAGRGDEHRRPPRGP